ncbi:hypothetical protein C8R45DRAFT_1089608 [Mycena sanguinolenta]|nr:hypothetical protein C8R45DRAFT_1089608 [Mycena sanguinolenta]
MSDSRDRSPSYDQENREERDCLWITDDDHEEHDEVIALFRERSFEEEFQGYQEREGAVDPSDDEYADANESWSNNEDGEIPPAMEELDRVPLVMPSRIRSYATRQEALEDIMKDAPKLVELVPPRNERDNPDWNMDWLCQCRIGFKDERSMTRMKIIANCGRNIHDIRDVLNAALKLGLKFHLYTPERLAHTFANQAISSADQLALPKIYEAGHTERFMTKAVGNETQYRDWLVSAAEVVRRPNAVAFISEGGILSQTAQLLDTTLLQ